MSAPDLRERLADMHSAIELISSIWDGRGEGDYREDVRDRLATERLLQILSEAARHVPEKLRRRHAAIDWRRLIDLGNVLRHAYHRVDDALIWLIVQTQLPSLAEALEAMSAELEKDSP